MKRQVIAWGWGWKYLQIVYLAKNLYLDYAKNPQNSTIREKANKE